MQDQRLDFHRTFRVLSTFTLGTFNDTAKRSTFVSKLLSNIAESQMVDSMSAERAWNGWLEKYVKRLEEEQSQGVEEEKRIQGMKNANPRFVLRQWLLEEVIKKVENDELAGRRVLAKVLHMACNPYEPWGAEETEGVEEEMDDEQKEERRYCGIGDKNLLGFQCSCSS